MSQLPYVLSAVMLALMFYVFHIGFSRVMRSLRTQRSAMKYRPEMMGLLQTVLPAFHPAFSLLMNGLRGGSGNTPASSTWYITLLFAEFELFAFFVAMVFKCSKYAHEWYQKQIQNENDNENTNNRQPPPSNINNIDTDVHEGFSTHRSINTNDDNDETDTNRTPPEYNSYQPDEHTVWNVANQFWQETNIGSQHTHTEESIYLFPFDVTQTAFYTLHFYFKQLQNTYVNKKIVVQSSVTT